MAGDFSDDEWDISDDQLQVLENNAVLSTQQQAVQNGSSGRHITAKPNSLQSGSTIRLDTPILARVAANARQHHGLDRHEKEDSFDNPVLDEDGVPLVIEERRQQTYSRVTRTDEIAQREQWRLNRHGPQNAQPVIRPPAKAIPHNAYQTYQQQNPQHGRAIQQHQAPTAPKTPVGTQLTPSSQALAHQPTRLPDQSTLRSEFEKTKREKELLQQKLDSITSDLHTARGENAVIRSKVASDAKLAERQLNATKRQLQEQTTKHQAEIQSRDAAYNKLQTDYSFVKHESDEQTRKIQSLQRQVREKSTLDEPTDTILSPRKNLRNTLRDGFDDDEIMQFSPTRSPAKRRTPKPTTPSKKRKLPGNVSDGPSLTLRFSQAGNESNGQLDEQQAGDDESAAQNEVQPKTKPTSTRLVVKDHQIEEHLTLLQTLLIFSPPGRQETIVECLASFTFPSDPSRSLSSLLLLETSKIKGERLPGDLLAVFTQLLSRCAREQFYKPVSVLLASVDLILDLDPTVVDAQVLQTLLKPLQTLATVNPGRRFHLEKNQVWDEHSQKPKIDADVNTTTCLDLLFIVASLVLDEPELIKLFWRCIDTEFVLLMLTPYQPITDLQLILELLSTSIQTDTFGNICSPDEQSRMEVYTVDKVCFLLWDPPRHTVKLHPRRPYSFNPPTPEKRTRRVKKPQKVPEDLPSEPPPSRLDICNLRLQVISLLSSLLTSPSSHPHFHPTGSQPAHHGTSVLLSHPIAIVRLVRCLYDEVSMLSANLPTHNLHAKLVNTITTILHHVLLSPSATDAKGSFDLQRALSGTSAGVHKFRVVMTRIAFREERSIAETSMGREGITEESARKATEVLEEYVTPDEAVQLVEVLGRPDADVDGEGDGEDVAELHEMDDREPRIADDQADRAEMDVMADIER